MRKSFRFFQIMLIAGSLQVSAATLTSSADSYDRWASFIEAIDYTHPNGRHGVDRFETRSRTSVFRDIQEKHGIGCLPGDEFLEFCSENRRASQARSTALSEFKRFLEYQFEQVDGELSFRPKEHDSAWEGLYEKYTGKTYKDYETFGAYREAVDAFQLNTPLELTENFKRWAREVIDLISDQSNLAVFVNVPKPGLDISCCDAYWQWVVLRADGVAVIFDFNYSD